MANFYVPDMVKASPVFAILPSREVPRSRDQVSRSGLFVEKSPKLRHLKDVLAGENVQGHPRRCWTEFLTSTAWWRGLAESSSP